MRGNRGSTPPIVSVLFPFFLQLDVWTSLPLTSSGRIAGSSFFISGQQLVDWSESKVPWRRRRRRTPRRSSEVVLDVITVFLPLPDSHKSSNRQGIRTGTSSIRGGGFVTPKSTVQFSLGILLVSKDVGFHTCWWNRCNRFWSVMLLV